MFHMDCIGFKNSFYINYEEFKAIYYVTYVFYVFGFILTMRNLKSSQIFQNCSTHLSFILTMRNLKHNKINFQLPSNQFYINYEEFKVIHRDISSKPVLCFILTMRNLKFYFYSLLKPPQESFILTMRNLKFYFISIPYSLHQVLY